ncbi:long-chain-fatty-acid--CoA ligase [Jiella sp. MQZ9-1]|uniref:3-methylmercaptopropionyl-CoA ligase n=1 Tax=Jiella flava TaxID=2816857 RepID=A0A939FYG6_9HYPH|nr:long-chain-fatty-acid--CoA ligase [Jiella flava]MBO0662323.1 long-chain-fatty-acid--CoA ligase [Jiella flava]MCD2470848.1 long-chain-fatty-acid--CoA ligase [Jiella flava]
MQGLMQHWPLLCSKVIDHAAHEYPLREVVSRSVEGPMHRTNYREVRERALKIAQLLEREGFGLGDRIATMAWNTWRHLECWYGITGIGAIYHTLNPRLFPEQIAWIMNDAEDKLLFVDLTFVPLVEALAPQIASLEKVIVLTDAAHMPETTLPNAVAYEEWLKGADGDFSWRVADENVAAGMCYTSGTTGHPKGVVYSHRSNVLHSMIAQAPDAMGLSSADRMLPIVPLFHANGWGIALTSPMSGAAMVMPGAKMDGASIYDILTTERVTLSAAVPTVWLMLLQHLETSGGELPDLKRVIIGGSACPRRVTEAFQNRYGVKVIHAWGMTEMSPLGTLCSIKPEYADLEGEALLALEEKQGFAPFGVEMKVTDDANVSLPRDGQSFGRLKVRGPAVAKAYYKNQGAEMFDDDGWFDTGDVAHIDPHGYMQITDRAKDVIKSGGEWISTIKIENLAVGHPGVAEAAVIGLRHPKWDERPLLVCVPKAGGSLTKDDLLGYLDGKIAKWWMPDDVVFVDEIPHTATGKIQKTALRKNFADYVLPTV